MSKSTINIRISSAMEEKIQIFKTYLNVSFPRCIIFLLSNQVIEYNKLKTFNCSFISEKMFKQYNKKFTIRTGYELYNKLDEISEKEKIKPTLLIANMIECELQRIFRDCDSEDVIMKIKKDEHRKINSIPISQSFYDRLEKMADTTGLSVNSLSALILGDFIVKNYEIMCDYLDGGLWQ